MKILDIDAMSAPAGSIVFKGQEHAVNAINGRILLEHHAAKEASESDAVLTMYKIAAQLVPTLSEAQVMTMTPAAVSQIVELALVPVNGQPTPE